MPLVMNQMPQVGLRDGAARPHPTEKGWYWLTTLEELGTNEVPTGDGPSPDDFLMSTWGVIR